MDTQSTHILAELLFCPADVLDDLDAIEAAMRQAAVAAGATIVRAAFHRFAPQGVSGVVVVEESHLSIHTWPERGYAAVDFFTCGDCRPAEAQRVLAQALGAGRVETMRLDRGHIGAERMMRVASHRSAAVAGDGAAARPPTAPAADRYFAEHLSPGFGLFYTVKRSILRRQTPYQTLEILDTDAFGKVLQLDRITQVVEKNDWQYHEPMVHPALTTHPDPKRVCVIGGGDGGVMREVLRHGPERAIQCDLDAAVMEACERHLPEINQGVFRHPAVHCVIRDGRQFIEETDEIFDVVIMDMTDPFGPSRRLYTREHFTAVKRTLRDRDGLFVMHCEGPVSWPAAYQQILRTLGDVWAHQHVFYVYVQMYGTLWAIVVSGDTDAVATITAEELAARLEARGITGLHVYSPATHHAMQVGFPYIDAIRSAARDARPITDADDVVDGAGAPDPHLRITVVEADPTADDDRPA